MRSVHGACLALIMGMAASCSQEGTIEVANLSGGDVSGSIDGARFSISDGQAVVQDIEIGSKFIFGPNDKDVSVLAQGDCIWDHEWRVSVRDDEITTINLYGETGYLYVVNYTAYPIDVYAASCSIGDWGYPIGTVASGDEGLWQADVGCWDVRFEVNGQFYYSYDVDIGPCDVQQFTWNAPGDREAVKSRCGAAGSRFDPSAAIPLSSQRVSDTTGAPKERHSSGALKEARPSGADKP